MAETTVATEGKECLITLVKPGSSDRLIKVFPAEHTTEKIWLDNTPGKERWEMIERMIQLHASRFSTIPEPKPWHGDPRDLKTVTMTKDEIPTVKLENFVLPAPPPVPDMFPKPEPTKAEKAMEERMAKMETTVANLADLLTKAFGNIKATAPVEKTEDTDTAKVAVDIPAEEPAKRGPGRPKKTA